MNCSVAQALEILGDWWTLLIVRDAFLGVKRFGDFQTNLGIAKNVLADRLARLVDHGVLAKHDAGMHGHRYEYHLTEKGSDLLPVLTALRDWADRWVYGEGNEPIVVKERATGRRLPRLYVRDHRGRPLERWQLVVEPGPGATAQTRAMLERLQKNRRVALGLSRPDR